MVNGHDRAVPRGRTVRMLLIGDDGAVRLVPVELFGRSIAELHAFARIEPTISVEGVSPWHAYVASPPRPPDSGPYNYMATALAKGAGWWTDDRLYGTVAFFGDQGGAEVDTPWDLLQVGAKARLWNLVEI